MHVQLISFITKYHIKPVKMFSSCELKPIIFRHCLFRRSRLKNCYDRKYINRCQK